MKSLILSILTLLLTGLGLELNAQVTAVMQAKVEVISGAGFTTLTEHLIDLDAVSAFDNFEAGEFTLVATPGSEISVHVENTGQIINENGEKLNIESLKAEQIISDNGEHQVSVNGTVNDLQSLSGHYQGDSVSVFLNLVKAGEVEVKLQVKN